MQYKPNDKTLYTTFIMVVHDLPLIALDLAIDDDGTLPDSPLILMKEKSAT